MSSPFSSFEEFSNAEGPIYTFANNSVMITLLLIISLMITVYFLYASFGMKQLNKSVDAKAIGLLIIAGFATVTGALFNSQPQKTETIHARSPRLEQASQRGWQPLALLGLTSLGGATLRRKRRTSRMVRSGQRSRLGR